MTRPDERTDAQFPFLGEPAPPIEVHELQASSSAPGTVLNMTDELGEARSVEGWRFRGDRWLAVAGSIVRSRRGLIGLILVVVVVGLAVFAPLVARYDPDLTHADSLQSLNQTPSWSHWAGTDYLGRDLWARIVWGGRLSLPAGVEIVLISLIIGVPMGIIAGYGNRIVDDVLMRIVDLLLALPGLILAFSIVAILGVGLKSVVIGVGIATIPAYARVARGSTLSAKATDFVLASRAQGGGPFHIMLRHILPNILDPLVVLATLNLSGGILAAAAFSFLGIGSQPPASDWGTLVSNGYQFMFRAWSELVFPAAIIVVTVLGINFVGDALGEALNPRLDRR